MALACGKRLKFHVRPHAIRNMQSAFHMAKPIAFDQYEAIAERFAERIDYYAWNAYYDRPAMLALLPDVNGRDVLDAGCGPGAYAQELVARGARVVGIDASPTMIALAEKRLNQQARFLVANLDMPLDILSQNSFDGILSALALDYVRDWDTLFLEFSRILRAGGFFVFSVQHPLSDYVLNMADDYLQTELYQQRFRSIDPKLLVPTYRRPLHAALNPLARAGFVLEQLHEPQPTKEFREQFPEQYERLMRRPDFMMIKARKRV